MLVVVQLALGGCSISWVDEASGTHHLLGLGHLKMKAIQRIEGQQLPSTQQLDAVITQIQTFGVQVGIDQTFGGVTAGWDSRTRVILDPEGANFGMLWPTNSFWMPFNLNKYFTFNLTTNPFQLNLTTNSVKP